MWQPRRAWSARRLRRWKRNTVRAAAAALIAGAAAEIASAAEWVPGDASSQGSFVLETIQDTPQEIDLDGDGHVDFRLSSEGYGGVVYLEPLIVNGVNNRVFADETGQITQFALADDILSAPREVVRAPEIAQTETFYYDESFVGLIFEVPGNSPYYGYLQLRVTTDNAIISDSGYQLVSPVSDASQAWGAIKALYAAERR